MILRPTRSLVAHRRVHAAHLSRSISGARQVVLTGATGRVGRHLAARLVTKGDNVAIVVRDVARGEGLAAELRSLTSGAGGPGRRMAQEHATCCYEKKYGRMKM